MTPQAFENLVSEFNFAHDSQGDSLDMSVIIVSQKDRMFSHYFKTRKLIDIRSLTKPIVCMAFGSAIFEGLYFADKKITLDTKIGPLISKYAKIAEENLLLWNEITIRDCFRMTLGHDKGLLFSDEVKNVDPNFFLEFVLNYPISKRPGIDFMYTNAGTFILSTLITEYLNISLEDFVDHYIFQPLNIVEYSWKKYGKYCAGCTGLQMYCEDLHKIAELFINNGKHQGKQVVPMHWIKNMIMPLGLIPNPKYDNNRDFPKFAYGLNMWICGESDINGIFSINDIVFCDGADGQLMIIDFVRSVVITTMGNQRETVPITRILRNFLETNLFGEL